MTAARAEPPITAANDDDDRRSPVLAAIGTNLDSDAESVLPSTSYAWLSKSAMPLYEALA